MFAHNSFKKGITKYGYNAEELCLTLYYFFKRSSYQWQDLFEIEEYFELEELILLHHILSSWFFFYSFFRMTSENQRSSQQVNVTKSDKCIAIKKVLESKEVDAEK